ncbi:MAG: hypothetical protein EXQ88_00645 [Alphaproteobacteria bacterium]|nr:hypothetical protein [Alphaproteobacteria bacterium]
MVRYLGPIPVMVPEGGSSLRAAETGSAPNAAKRLWQRVTYVAATLMTASLAFIALAAADDIANAAQEMYFLSLRVVGGLTGI